MPFPAAPRVLYNNNPLAQVVCQLRFPPILSIDANIPADFQEFVRADFPNFAEASEFKFEIPSPVREQIPAELFRQVAQSASNKNYKFSSAEEDWNINLTRTFVSLSSTNYRRWEEFRTRLELPLQALIEIYRPDYFSRVGLRYVDLIRRSDLNLEDSAWSELLSPYVIGMLASPDTVDFVTGLEASQEIELAGNDGTARIISRLVNSDDPPEVSFVLDSDFFKRSRTEIDDSMHVLDFFNTRSSRLIRWAITDRLHDALGPELI